MNRRRFLATLAAAGALSALPASFACSTATEVKAKEARSSTPRAAVSQSAIDALPAFVRRRNAFAWKLYRTLVDADRESNAFISPHSISVAMAMAYAGATGNTAAELARALEFEGEPVRTHEDMNALDAAIAKSSEKTRDDLVPLELSVANSAWFDKDTDFVEAYLDTLAMYYGAGAWRIALAKEPEASREQINTWVEERTNNRIQDLIPEGVIDAQTVLVLVNAIYFKAQWAFKFDVEKTTPEAFTLLSGIERRVPFMHQTEQFRYTTLEGVQAVELPYNGGQASMVILMPHEGGLDALRANIGDLAPRALASMKSVNMELAMPKWKFADDHELVPAFQSLGVKDAFTPDATFDITRNTPPEYISAIIHKAFVAVDEEGTEAAAATAVVMRATSAPPPPIPVAINRPFLFFIRHVPTDAILFIGRVVEPAE